MKINGLVKFAGVALLVLVAGTAFAQQHADGPSHSHKAHHGGSVKSAGDYHIEIVDQGEKLTVYLLDAREKAIDLSGVTGMAILRAGDQTIGTQKLTLTGNSYFEAPIKGQNATAIIITFKVNNQSIIAKFNKDGSQALNYYCPQKCVGSDSNLAGNCPKCGSALLDRRLVAKD